MPIEFFTETEEFRTSGYNSALTSSFQGQLASSYTDALATTLQQYAADWIGFLANSVNGLSVSDALEVKAAVEAGTFSLSGLFGAAQSSTGPVDGADVADPSPTLSVTIGSGTYQISLLPILSDLDTETWTRTDTTGGGKKAVTTTTHHTREFYTDADVPAGYDADWSVVDVNEAPVVAPINVEATEHLSTYDAGIALQNGSDDGSLLVDLLDPSKVNDPDGDLLSVASIQFYDASNTAIATPSYISVDLLNGTFTIDQNSRDLDHLKKDEQLVLTAKYMVSDGTVQVENTVNVVITGTGDKFYLDLDPNLSQSITTFAASWDGSISFTFADAPAGAYDFSGTANVSVTGDIDLDAADNANDETVTVTLEGGGTPLVLGAFEGAPNQEPPGNTSTRAGSVAFASADATVTGGYDSNVAGGVNGVDGLTTVGVTVSDYYYWV